MERQLNELALFAGAGGGILGGKLLGWRTVCAVEIDPYARRVLLARQADGCLEPFPIWDDVTTFDGHPWRGRVDVVSGGFPCQDISAAGNGAGLDGARSGLWAEFARIIGEVQPTYVWVENSPMLLVRGIDRVLWDLAALGYDARWGVFSAADVGARHLRERIWIMAHSVQNRRAQDVLQNNHGATGERGASSERCNDWVKPDVVSSVNGAMDEGWVVMPDAARAFDDVANLVDRLACTGNGQVPSVVALAWRTLASGL